jgi:hypothetical protein
MFCDSLANGGVVGGSETEFSSCSVTGDIKIKPAKDDLVALADYAALCMAASIFAATANADNPHVGRI